ncbi:hypothetical protein GJ744_001612 [Endocarpon pusillum]|uniref:Uncharacterized protein n=1 Tax=Endocarpon pusillum TaxID=364733 RepID=A0A8H7AD18_9EURO|nr:hypothetical protein GJ744_001612 [Endocarpon pusillum]
MSAGTGAGSMKRGQEERPKKVRQLEVNLTLLREDTWAYGCGRAEDKWGEGEGRADQGGEGERHSKQGDAVGGMDKQNRRGSLLSVHASLSSPSARSEKPERLLQISVSHQLGRQEREPDLLGIGAGVG